MKYEVVVGGEPSGCPSKMGIADSTHIVVSETPIEVGASARQYSDQIRCVYDCHSWASGLDCNDVVCKFGEIISVKRIG